ncbi:MAG: hypothetical protein NC489_43740 [Ruminococcus flavefaciens]|nr:hypothetical protein [Ruminococcus flavefaciens]
MGGYSSEAIEIGAGCSSTEGIYQAKAGTMYNMQKDFFSKIKRVMLHLGYQIVWEEDKSINMSGNTILQDVYTMQGIEKYIRYIYSFGIDTSVLKIYVSIDDELKLFNKNDNLVSSSANSYAGNVESAYDFTNKQADKVYTNTITLRSPIYINILEGKNIKLLGLSVSQKSREFTTNWFGTALLSNGEQYIIAKYSDGIKVHGEKTQKINYNLLTGMNIEEDGKIAVMPVYFSSGVSQNDVIKANYHVIGCLQNAGNKVPKGSSLLIDDKEYLAIETNGRLLIEL